jgi:hypothetical protein
MHPSASGPPISPPHQALPSSSALPSALRIRPSHQLRHSHQALPSALPSTFRTPTSPPIRPYHQPSASGPPTNSAKKMPECTSPPCSLVDVSLCAPDGFGVEMVGVSMTDNDLTASESLDRPPTTTHQHAFQLQGRRRLTVETQPSFNSICIMLYAKLWGGVRAPNRGSPGRPPRPPSRVRGLAVYEIIKALPANLTSTLRDLPTASSHTLHPQPPTAGRNCPLSLDRHHGLLPRGRQQRLQRLRGRLRV